ncbi:MAG: phosphopantothenoylcysteine decarboxylase, partial [Aristaeellaceae bacterium]
ATRERLDPVRYMTNDSSGKMGFALAEAARARGAKVTVVAGSTTAREPEGVTIVRIESTRDLLEAVTARAGEMDVIIQAAAPADYRFARQHDQKLKKQEGAPLVLELVENPDVAAAVGRMKKPGQVLVGFAAETENLLENARRKLDRKNLDMIVANDVSKPGAGFNVDTNIATLLTRDGATECPLQQKTQLAHTILDQVLLLRNP